jgi:Protein of unknown function (DUF3592)
VKGGRGRAEASYRPRATTARRRIALALLFSLPIIFIAAGIWSLLIGLGIRSQIEPVHGWHQTTGWIAGFHTSNTGRELTYSRVIRFRAGEHVVSFTAPATSAVPVVGAVAQVSYDPSNPADAHDLSMGSAWEPALYVGIGGLLLGVALMAFLCWLIFFRFSPAHQVGRSLMAENEGRHVRGG